MERSANEQKLALVVLDLVAFFAALHAAIWFRYHAGFEFSKGGAPPWEEIFRALPLVAVAWVVMGGMFGSYRLQRSVVDELAAAFRATMLTFLLALSATFFYRGFSYSRGMMLFFMPLVFVAVATARIGFRVVRRRVLSRFAGRARIAVLGRTKIGESLIQALQRDRDLYEVVGVVETPRPSAEPSVEDVVLPALRRGPPVLGGIHELDRICKEHRLDTLVLVDRLLPEPLVLDSIEACLRHQVTWNMVPGVHDLFLDRARVDVVDGIPLVGMRRTNIVGFNWLAKRIFDVVVSAVLLVLAAPLMLSVALAVKLSSRGPVFYVQQRVGYRGQVFPFFKFRSMHVGNDDSIHREYTKRWITEGQGSAVDVDGRKVHKIVGDPRIFAIGRFIRKYSIDELPQLLNVFRGEMSLIGPRPALPYEVDVYREWHRRRFEAPPGITGLWQVSGRNRLTFDEMIKLDIDYLENWSFLRDLHILWRTVRVVLFEHAY